MRTLTRLAALALVALLTPACVKPVKPESFAANQPQFIPEQFFGTTAIGHGIIQSAGGKPARPIRVESRGTALADGSFRLDQTIYEGGKTRTRFWIMKRISANRYSATLSDADGPVTAEVHGNLFHLRYLLKKPFVTMEQWLYLQPDGRTVLNEGTIRMPGRTIARLSEIITRTGQ